MSTSSMSRGVATWFAIASALLSCARTGETGKNSETASATPTTVGTKTDTSFRINPKDVYDESWKTPLPEGVAPDAEKFRDQLRGTMGVKFPSGGTHRRRRAGKSCSGCAVTIEIGAFTPTRTIDPGIAPRPRPHAVALLQNLDPTNTEAFYGLKPKSNAAYYFWIDAPSARSRITVLEVPPRGSIHAGKQKYLEVCHWYRHRDTANYGDADFKEYLPYRCDDSSGTYKEDIASSFFVSVLRKTLARVRKAFDPVTVIAADGWIDCNSGCCY